MAFKNLRPDDYSVTPFTVSKTITVDYEKDVTDNSIISVLQGQKSLAPTLKSYYENPANANRTGGPYKKHVWELIRHMYYSRTDPYQRIGIESYNGIDTSSFDEDSTNRIWVIKVSPKEYGKKIDPGSILIQFPISSGSSIGTFDIIDDGHGNLYAENGVLVGNVFYSNGILVLTRRVASIDKNAEYTFFPEYAEFEGGVFDFNSFRNFTLSFRNQVELFEHEVRCVIKQHEFNGISNRSVVDEDGEFIDYFKSDDFRPFITTVGLYDEFLNLVAIAKLSHPVQKPKNMPLTITVKFDT